MIEKLLIHNGYDLDQVLVYSYKSSSNLNAANALAEFIKEVAPPTKIIIHRDNDFLMEEEIKKLTESIEKIGALPFITEYGSDIESYYIAPSHIAELMEVEEDEIVKWLDELALTNHNELYHKATRKRDEANRFFSRYEGIVQPDTRKLLGASVPLDKKFRLGKIMLRKINGDMHKKFGKTVNLFTKTSHIESKLLSGYLNT